MTEPRTNLLVKISADSADIKAALLSLRNELQKVKKDTDGIAARMAPSIRSMVGSIVGIGTVALAIRGIANATMEAEKRQAQLNAVLKSTGGAAGLTAKELNKMAESLQATTTFDDEAITGAQSLLLTFTKVGKDIFPVATKAILDMSVALGQDLPSTAIRVGKALQDPINGITALKRAGVSFSAAQKDVIKKLVETGHSAEAQSLILQELQKEFGGSAEAARNTLGGALQGLKNDFENVLEGDTGSSGAIALLGAINDLATTMRSPEVKEGFAVIIQGLAWIAKTAVQGTTAIVGIGQAMTDEFRGNTNKSELGLLSARADVDDRLTWSQRNTPSDTREIEWQKKKLAEIDAEINRRRAAGKIDWSHFEPPPPKQNASKESVYVSDEDRKKAEKELKDLNDRIAKGMADVNNGLLKSAGRDAEAAFNEIDQKYEKLLEDLHKKNDTAGIAKLFQLKDAEKAAVLKDMKDKADKDMAEINNGLLKATGHDAEAAFNEIDQKYSELLERLRKKNDTAGIAKLSELIGIEKAEAQLKIFEQAMNDVLSNLREKESNISAQLTAGLIGQVQAEQEVNTARKEAAEKMDALRRSAENYLKTLSPDNPEAQKVIEFLRKIGVEVKKVEDKQNKLLTESRDLTKSSLSTFFQDLITGAKSAKEAFADFVKAFVAGIARMIAERLAQIAVEKIFKAITGETSSSNSGGGSFMASLFGTYHTGGIVGAPSASRAVDFSVFSQAPRYHVGGIAGLRANEIPAILERGEEVLTRRDPRHRANGGAAGGNVYVQVENNGAGTARTEESSNGNDKIIRVIIDAAKASVIGDIARGGTGVNKALEGRYGMNPVGVARG